MIRINLLPRTGPQHGAELGNPIWFGGYLAAALVLCGGLAFLYLQLEEERAELARQNDLIEQQISEVKARGGDLEEVKAKLERSKKLADVVGGLLDARSGPARMLLEMSNVLTPGEGPTIDPEKFAELRRQNPQAGYTTGWDTRRLWLVSFNEQQHNCSMKGVGKNNEDVAEFLRRLQLSSLFDSITLRSTTAVAKAGVALINFDLNCRVTY